MLKELPDHSTVSSEADAMMSIFRDTVIDHLCTAHGFLPVEASHPYVISSMSGYYQKSMEISAGWDHLTDEQVVELHEVLSHDEAIESMMKDVGGFEIEEITDVPHHDGPYKQFRVTWSSSRY